MKHPPFKFGITYGALMGVTKRYAPFYENPRIQTPFCQFSGQWDPVVTVEMVDAVNRAHIGGDRSLKVVHPGAHAVCTERKYLDTVVDFINGVESYSMPLPSELESQELLIEHEILELASSGSVTSERTYETKEYGKKSERQKKILAEQNSHKPSIFSRSKPKPKPKRRLFFRLNGH
ncbi:Family of serine hydrolases 3 [Clarireedia jacksonii]